jgi:hypothetical protein
MRQIQSEIKILDVIAATGAGNIILCADFRHLDLLVATSGMGAGDTLVVKVQGSSALEAPDFDAAKTISNDWDYIQLVDKEDGATVDGDTGISFADSDDLRKFTINTDGLRWVTVNVISISDAVNTSVSAKITLYND